MPTIALYFTTSDGILRGRPYVREYVRRKLSQRWHRVTTADERRRALVETVDNDAWLAARNACLVSSIARDAETYLLGL